MGWLAGWDKRIELKIEDYAGDIGASVTWFPVTIHLKDANGDSTKVFLEVGANSRKIAITKTDGTTELKGEIEGWNYYAGTPANSTAEIHTSADGWTINSNTSIFLYYDNDHANNANIDAINTAAGVAVWDGYFKFVCHMVDATTSTVLDSTSNNNDGTKKGANEPIEATGKVGQAQDFAGDDDYINNGNNAVLNITGAITIEACIYPQVLATSDIIVCRGLWQTDGYFLQIGATANDLDFSFNQSEAVQYIYSNNAILSTNNWYYVAGVRSGASGYIYLNGADQTLSTDSIINPTTSARNAYLGVYNSELHNFFDGIIDEVRVSNTNRSAAWIKGTYNSLWDTLLTYGSEETEAVTVNAIMFGAIF